MNCVYTCAGNNHFLQLWNHVQSLYVLVMRSCTWRDWWMKTKSNKLISKTNPCKFLEGTLPWATPSNFTQHPIWRSCTFNVCTRTIRVCYEISAIISQLRLATCNDRGFKPAFISIYQITYSDSVQYLEIPYYKRR